ncbi:MAG: MotA/TolQ/ExbB proton channel family protein [Dissulfurimicrobium sp.]|uniref:MotA/TolQ/ExbB proton channel family protein n=1 Tax=Dissulfurimicrobium TaxID=1769732 RepID=UPI001EDC03CB|nr:MotA/TolQ/ExbB proton channel family protein [Dissulfurimicrobium hydrothermale]UKL12959.1 MotA/TolQ/ExbB proton channel family protein [Dissulfurimicrobium hydrothermale]
MDVEAILKSFLYIISSTLFLPVIFILSMLVIWICIYSGSFFAEWLERARLTRCDPSALPDIIKNGGRFDMLSHSVKGFIAKLEDLIGNGVLSSLSVENLVYDYTIRLSKSLDHLRLLIRLGPGLGLLGTLIPMGTGLSALSQGDMTRLSADLVVAFTTTIVGLAIGLMAFFFYTVKRRWVEEDIKNIELTAEILMESDVRDVS